VQDNWTSWGTDLHVALTGEGGRRAGLERALREAILGGRLAPGARLPSTRALANDLGLARGTVVEAYEQLAVEGYLVTRPGAAARVGQAPAAFERPDERSDPRRPPRHDLRVGSPDVSAFPREAWLKAMRTALRETPDFALATSDPRGEPRLRAALAEQLGRARGVVANPDRVLVCSGFSQGFSLLCRVLRAGGAQHIGLEDPCIPDYPAIARAAGLEVHPLGVDGEGALPPDRDLDAVLVTPAHQFPLGATMSPARRAALLEWARDAQAVVIEDDYDGEFRYDRSPVGALQGLDPGTVAYAGTASKTLAPGLRLGWLVLPPALAGPVAEMKELDDRHAPVLDQIALAALIEAGDFDRQVRRMRARYRRRRDDLVRMLGEHRATGIAAGLHAVVPVADAESTLARAERHSLALSSLTRFHHTPGDHAEALVVGYATPPDHGYAAALEALALVLA
jgi:GntR family transcriptional regulator/MocR family aminotransferase